MSASDYPDSAFRSGEQGATTFLLTIDTAGKPIKCDLVESSKSVTLDQASCAVAFRREEFKPAVDQNGQIVFGVIKKMTGWWLPDFSGKHNTPPVPPDLAIAVSRLPAGVHSPVSLTVAIVVNEKGSIEDCRPLPRDEDAKRLEALACKQVSSDWVAKPALDRDKRPVRSVQQISVAFVAEAPGTTETR